MPVCGAQEVLCVPKDILMEDAHIRGVQQNNVGGVQDFLLNTSSPYIYEHNRGV